ncbi:hypothetical protein [Helicobacter pylori]|nr:hypothetical protein [Helicobacter pylori]
MEESTAFILALVGLFTGITEKPSLKKRACLKTLEGLFKLSK